MIYKPKQKTNKMIKIEIELTDAQFDTLQIVADDLNLSVAECFQKIISSSS